MYKTRKNMKRIHISSCLSKYNLEKFNALCQTRIKSFLHNIYLCFHLFPLDVQLGLVIDLTNTSRYYPVTDLKKEGIKHVKVCSGNILFTNACFSNFVFKTATPILVLTFYDHCCCLDSMQGEGFCT